MADLAQSWPWGRDEAELVTELQAGSDAAFDWLVTYYHAGVYNLVYGILSDAADAADVTQEVFLRAFRGIRGFRGGSSLKTWLYRISVRQALNHRRWSWRHHRNQVSIDAEDERTGATLDVKDEDATPFDRLASQEMQATVRQALAEVPTLFRSAVILRDLEGLAYEEIAEVMETSIGTVKSRILRGRRLLKEILEPVLAGAGDTSAAKAAIHGAETTARLKSCPDTTMSATARLKSCPDTTMSATARLKSCPDTSTSATARLKSCPDTTTLATARLPFEAQGKKSCPDTVAGTGTVPMTARVSLSGKGVR